MKDTNILSASKSFQIAGLASTHTPTSLAQPITFLETVRRTLIKAVGGLSLTMGQHIAAWSDGLKLSEKMDGFSASYSSATAWD
jgi:hypothetical protein